MEKLLLLNTHNHYPFICNEYPSDWHSYKSTSNVRMVITWVNLEDPELLVVLC